MKWVPYGEEKEIKPIRPWVRFLVGGLTGFFLVYGPYLISQQNGAGIAFIILGGVGLGFFAVVYELYSLSKLWLALAGCVAGLMFTLSYTISAYFLPVALVSIGASIWLALREGEGDDSASGGGSQT